MRLPTPRGGTIVLGYDERGKQIGKIMPEDIENALREGAAQTKPPVRERVGRLSQAAEHHGVSRCRGDAARVHRWAGK